MERTLLVPLDGSPAAEAALPHALAVARATGWTIGLVQVVPFPMYDGLSSPEVFPANLQIYWVETIKAAEVYLAETAARLTQLGVVVEHQVLEGDPATMLLSHVSHDETVAMVVMATHGWGGFRHLILGSVAEKMLPSLPVPQLLVHSQEPFDLAVGAPYRTILVPLDGSAHSEQALHLAEQMARKNAAELVLMYSIQTPNDVALARQGYRPDWDDEHLADMRSKAGEYLMEKAAPYAAHDIPVRALVRDGHPGDQIVVAAREVGADLIVMATHGRTGLRRLWLGSMATFVVRHSPIPVLLVRDEVTARATAELIAGQELALPL
jgi:nucleotide-binding universal stress UspA family protein